MSGKLKLFVMTGTRETDETESDTAGVGGSRDISGICGRSGDTRGNEGKEYIFFTLYGYMTNSLRGQLLV